LERVSFVLLEYVFAETVHVKISVNRKVNLVINQNLQVFLEAQEELHLVKFFID
jgi:hypothetical protein